MYKFVVCYKFAAYKKVFFKKKHADKTLTRRWTETQQLIRTLAKLAAVEGSFD